MFLCMYLAPPVVHIVLLLLHFRKSRILPCCSVFEMTHGSFKALINTSTVILSPLITTSIFS
ncbi:hypothetical protein BDR22DRAFT_850940 [Usnea florida]